MFVIYAENVNVTVYGEESDAFRFVCDHDLPHGKIYDVSYGADELIAEW